MIHIADDAEYLNAIGSVWHGRTEIRAGWEALAKTSRAGDPVMDEYRLSMLSPTVALVTAYGHLDLPDGGTGNPARLPTFGTFVMVKADGRWLLKSGHTSAPPILTPSARQ